MVLEGFKRFTSKKGVPYCLLYVSDDFTAQEREYSTAVAGKTVDQVFVEADVASKLTEKDIGKNIRINYAVRGGRASVSDVVMA